MDTVQGRARHALGGVELRLGDVGRVLRHLKGAVLVRRHFGVDRERLQVFRRSLRGGDRRRRGGGRLRLLRLSHVMSSQIVRSGLAGWRGGLSLVEQRVVAVRERRLRAGDEQLFQALGAQGAQPVD